MQTKLKYPHQLQPNDSIDTMYGYTITIHSLIRVDQQPNSTIKKYVFQVSNNFNDKLYEHVLNGSVPVNTI